MPPVYSTLRLRLTVLIGAGNENPLSQWKKCYTAAELSEVSAIVMKELT